MNSQITSDKNVKILQVFNQYLKYGGEEGCVSRIAKALREKTELQTFYGSSSEALNHPLGRLRMPFLMQKNSEVLNSLRELQRNEKFDFWQIDNVFPAISVAVYELAVELNVPVLQYLHNYRFGCVDATYFREGAVCRDCSPSNLFPGVMHGCWRGSRIASGSMAAALKRMWNKGSIDAMKGYIALSESQKQEHVAMGIPAEKIEVIYHSLAAGDPPASLPTEKGDILFLGRLTEEKGIDLLLRAWGKVNAHGRTLRIAGDGPELTKLRGLADDLSLKNVIFEGFVPAEKQAEMWRESAFLVAPSVWLEPFGMVVLEAWKHGRPVLATNHGSFPELIIHGSDGWLAEPNPVAFAEALQVAIDSGEQIHELGSNGRVKLEKRFNHETWLRRIWEVYQKFGLVE